MPISESRHRHHRPHFLPLWVKQVPTCCKIVHCMVPIDRNCILLVLNHGCLPCDIFPPLLQVHVTFKSFKIYFQCPDQYIHLQHILRLNYSSPTMILSQCCVRSAGHLPWTFWDSGTASHLELLHVSEKLRQLQSTP